MRLSSSPSYLDNLRKYRIGTPKKPKLSRRSAASTALLGSPKTSLQSNLLSPFLLSPTKPLKITRFDLKSPRKPQTDTRNLPPKGSASCKKLMNFSHKNEELEELRCAVQITDKRTAELKKKISRFEALFDKLYRCLEEGEGTDELKKLSLVVYNELNRKIPKTGKAKGRVNAHISSDPAPNKVSITAGNIKDQLSMLRKRTAHLINFLKIS